MTVRKISKCILLMPAFLLLSVPVHAESAAEQLYENHCSSDGGEPVRIDILYGNVYIISEGTIHERMMRCHTGEISTDTSVSASEGQDGSCAGKAAEETGVPLSGRTAGRPVKAVTNTLLALLLSVLVSWGIVLYTRRKDVSYRLQSALELQDTVSVRLKAKRRTSLTKTYMPKPSPVKDTSGRSISSGGGHRF